MSRLTKPGLSHSPSIGGTGICIDQIDQGAILIGTGVDFDLNTLTAGPGVAIVNGPGTITISATGTFELPIASPTSLGGIKVGANLSIDGAGVLSAGNPYVLPIASASVLGGIKVGANLSIDVGGVLSGTAPYVLPTASSLTLGGIKVGSNLSIDGSGVLSGAAPYTLPIASATVLGGIKVGANLSISGSGVLSGSAPYTLPIASASVLGGIKVGTGLAIDGSGVLSSSGGGTVTSVAITVPTGLSVSGSPITTSGTFTLSWSSETQNYVFAAPSGSSGTPSFRPLVSGDIPNLDVAKITTGTFATSFIPNLDASKITTGLLSTSRGGTGVDSSGASNGQLLIGTGTGLALSTLTAGASMAITNTSGGITIDFVGSGGGGGFTSPLTTKGDLWTYSTVNTRIGVGSNNQFLVADSSQSTGLLYRVLSASDLPIATAISVGAVRPGRSLLVATDGTLRVSSVDADQVLSVSPSVIAVGLAGTLAIVSSVAGVADPTTAPTLVATTPGTPTSLLAGTYKVGYLWVTSIGRTTLSPVSSITITAGQGIQATCPSLPVGVSSAEFYTSDCFGAGGSWSGGAGFGSFNAQSWSGGAGFGSFSAESWSGGASVAGLTWGYQFDNTGTCTRTMGFLKVPSAPASDMIIFDWDFVASGYFRLKLTSTLHLILEHNLSTFNNTLDINAGVAITTGVWAWIEIWPYTPSGENRLRFRGHCSQSGTDREGISAFYSIGSATTFNGRLGIGTTTSTSYLAFPNTAGWEMSKVQAVNITSNTGPTGVPIVDASGGICLFLARQTVGTVSQLNDTSGNGNNAAAGSQGLTINTDGPYP